MGFFCRCIHVAVNKSDRSCSHCCCLSSLLQITSVDYVWRDVICPCALNFLHSSISIKNLSWSLLPIFQPVIWTNILKETICPDKFSSALPTGQLVFDNSAYYPKEKMFFLLTGIWKKWCRNYQDHCSWKRWAVDFHSTIKTAKFYDGIVFLSMVL